ncbi:pitrilysin family protein [uncultured Muribaculum sp.]|uniref:M16 family metallopeptidase n=1 Tax=uncultured Muribaculum sp. TaxID=1918613 RepID=UPI002637E146|nr:pitrilysin family protein [uncultured Muribaculum sp.]
MTQDSSTTPTYHTLSNRLRVVHRYCRSEAEYCGLCVMVGSRNEHPDHFGLAHFVEHTIFKGTERRRSWHIINRMESVGGELNAFTSEEATTIYSSFPAGNLPRAVELIADLVSRSRFPTPEIDREREVVLDEVASYLDSPSEAIFDDFNELLFAGSGLGHNILGTEKTIHTFSSDTCRSFLDRYYTPGNMVFFYMGPTPPQRVIAVAERYMGHFNHPDPELSRTIPPEVEPFDTLRTLGTHQAHTIVGARIPGMYADKNRAYSLLTNIIGGPCMNSLLNVALRERRGYVYSVDAYTSLFTDCGEFTIYFGCDPEHVKPCRRIISDTLSRMADSPMKERTLAAAKKQYVGQTIVAAENREQMALSTGRALLFNGHVAPQEEIVERIMSLSAENLRMAAEAFAPERCSILTFC